MPVQAVEFSSETLAKLAAVNLMGVAHGIEAVLPHILDQRSGHIAVVASAPAHFRLPTAAAYGASEAALINRCRTSGTRISACGRGRRTTIRPHPP